MEEGIEEVIEEEDKGRGWGASEREGGKGWR